MSNINKMTANKQLFTELTHKEGSVIEGGSATLYRDINRKGGGYRFRNSYSDLTRLNFNDVASSITIPYGEVWQLFEHINYQGRSRFFRAGTWNLTDFRFNDKVSSLRRYA